MCSIPPAVKLSTVFFGVPTLFKLLRLKGTLIGALPAYTHMFNRASPPPPPIQFFVGKRPCYRWSYVLVPYGSDIQASDRLL